MAIELLNIDCMTYMAGLKDKEFDLAIVDPVFGEQVTQGGYMTNSSSSIAKNIQYNNNIWKQSKSDSAFFNELFRISANQIIWGGNYFTEEIGKNSSCWIVWNKRNGDNHFADCEIAWTSFKTAVRMFEYKWQGMLQHDMKNKEVRIHPTQKPVALYKWLLKNYAKPGDKILDTHGGSMSIAISCHQMGFDLTLCEIDKDYYDSGVKRYNEAIKQQTLFSYQ